MPDILDEIRKADPLSQIMGELSTLTNAIIQEGVESIFGEMEFMDYESNKILEAPSTEAPPEVKRKCPFCGKGYGEHRDIAEHMAERHTEDTIARYETEIKRFYEHPEETPGRFKWLAHRDVGDLWTINICPFCEKKIGEFSPSALNRHVREKHGAFMEVFSKVLRGESP